MRKRFISRQLIGSDLWSSMAAALLGGRSVPSQALIARALPMLCQHTAHLQLDGHPGASANALGLHRRRYVFCCQFWPVQTRAEQSQCRRRPSLRPTLPHCTAAADVSTPAPAEHPTPAEAEDELNWFARVWRAYNRVLHEKPILVKSATSFVGFLVGDVLAQNIVGRPFDIYRTLRLVLFGVFMDGPVGAPCYSCEPLHSVIMSSTRTWVQAMCGTIRWTASWSPRTPSPTRRSCSRCCATRSSGPPFFSCVFFTFIYMLQAGSFLLEDTSCVDVQLKMPGQSHLGAVQARPDLIVPTIQAKLIPMLLANYALW